MGQVLYARYPAWEVSMDIGNLDLPLRSGATGTRTCES